MICVPVCRRVLLERELAFARLFDNSHALRIHAQGRATRRVPGFD
jgi:hypothetical protein